MSMKVYQFVKVSDEGVNEVLWDLLQIPLPQEYSPQVGIAGADISSERHSDFSRLTRRGRIMSLAELQEWMQDSLVAAGWFFIGMPGKLGDPVEPVDVQNLIVTSAFVVDVLDARLLGVRTIVPVVAQLVRETVLEIEELETCDVSEVRLAY